MSAVKGANQTRSTQPARRFVPGLARSSEPAPATSATPTARPSTSAFSLPQNLLELIDLVVRVTLSGPAETVLKGRVFSYDPTSGLLALECAPSSVGTSKAAANSSQRDYRLVRLSHIKEIAPLGDAEGVLPASGTTVQLRALSTTAVQGIERAAVKAEEQRIAKKGPPGVSKLGQGIFDGLCKTLPCRWQEMTIVVLDDVYVHAPYHRAVSDKADRQKLDRVTKVLEGTRTAFYRQQTRQDGTLG